MAANKPEAPSSSNPFDRASRIPDDTVFFAIFPDSSLSSSSLQTLHLQILQTLAPFAGDYIWQHEPFALSLAAVPLPHLAGKLRYGDSLDDEWFVVFLLLQTSIAFPELSIRVWDTDGEFLLIEAAYHLPPWLDPENSENRVFLRRGELHIVPKTFSPNPSLEDSLRFLVLAAGEKSRASEAVQAAVRSRVAEYPEKARRNVHTVRVRVPASVARVLRDEPCLISFAVEGFYDRDVDSMKFAAKMERFLAGGEEMVTFPARMSRAMYAQTVQQAFQAPKRYPMPKRSGVSATEFAEAEMGMKIACGFEMAYQQRRKAGSEGNGGSMEAFRESLERNGYFRGLIPGSQEHRRLMISAEEYYRNSASFSRARYDCFVCSNSGF